MNLAEVQKIKQQFGIIGNDPALLRAIDTAIQVAHTDLSVLITGESGVGKEFFPKIVHTNSVRKHGKYIAVNCGAIPEGTIDSELFGHVKGAFTGAVNERKGYFSEADGGTIFLDEVAELPLSTQARLLRVLENGEFLRVGSSDVEKTDVRIVCATNVNLTEAIADGRFREDLYYRLNTVPITVPALRERPEDIHLLFRRFATEVATQYKMPAITLDSEARAMLENHYWRGNIRQLKNVAEQISAIEESRNITAPILAKYIGEQSETSPSVNSSSRIDDINSERELLYKILFDMRSDINDLKRMISDLHGGFSSYRGMGDSVEKSEVKALLPHSTRNDEYYTDSEVVEEVREVTKADMQREQIIKALRRNGGSRRAAAAELFMSERTLYRKIKDLNIEE